MIYDLGNGTLGFQIYTPSIFKNNEESLHVLISKMRERSYCTGARAYAVTSEAWTKLAAKYPAKRKVDFKGIFRLIDTTAITDLSEKGTLIFKV